MNGMAGEVFQSGYIIPDLIKRMAGSGAIEARHLNDLLAKLSHFSVDSNVDLNQLAEGPESALLVLTRRRHKNNNLPQKCPFCVDPGIGLDLVVGDLGAALAQRVYGAVVGSSGWVDHLFPVFDNALEQRPNHRNFSQGWHGKGIFYQGYES